MSEDFFNLERKPKKKGRNDIALSVAVIALIFLLVLGFVAIREYNAREILSSASQNMAASVERAFFGEEEMEKEEEKEIIPEEETEDIETEEEEDGIAITARTNAYTERAHSGDGLTHVARRAITSHMEKEGLELSDEERVFAEDYVQKTLQQERGSDFLEVEEEVEISEELIDEALEEVGELTPEELENLEQYSALVTF